VSLFTRLFLTYLGVTLLALGGMFLVVDLLSPSFYQGHVHHMVQMMGPMGLDLRADKDCIPLSSALCWLRCRWRHYWLPCSLTGSPAG